MKLVLDGNKCKTFVEIFKNIKSLATVANIVVNSEGMYLNGMDQAHICCYDMVLSKQWFDEYELDTEESIVLGVNINILHKILSTKQEGQKLQLGYVNNGDKLNILFISEDKKMFNNWFAMPLIDLDIDNVDIPEKEHQVDINLPVTTLTLLIEQISIFNDRFKIECKDTGIVFIVDGEDGNMRLNMDLEAIEDYSIEEDLELKCGYSTKLVQKICSFKQIASGVFIGLSKNYPMEIKYTIDDNSYFRAMIAPNIDEEDD